MAHAYLGSVTPGAEGLTELEKASQLGSKLPEPEKLEIQALLAGTRGEELKARAAWEKLAQLAPGDWHVHFTLGGVYSGERKWDQAAAELKRANCTTSAIPSSWPCATTDRARMKWSSSTSPPARTDARQ